MRKIFLFGLVLTLFVSIILAYPPPSNALQDPPFSVTYVAPGYTASEFLSLEYPTAALEFDSEANLYVSNAYEFGPGIREILRLDAATDYTTWSFYASYATLMYGLNGLDFDYEGNLFVSECKGSQSNSNAGLIRKIDDAGNVIATKFWSSFRPTGVAAGKTEGMADVYFPGRKWSAPGWGNIYGIGLFPYSDEVIVRNNLVATGIAIDDFGTFFVATWYDNSIWTRDPYTQAQVRVATFDRLVEELNFDWEGNLYALEMRQGTDYSTIIRLSPGGIDIKPGSFPNCFNQNGHGGLPVAMLGSAALDVNDIDVDSLILQGLNIKMAGKSDKYLAHTDYVNDDEYLDLVVQFEDSDGWLAPGNDYVLLEGNLDDGRRIWAGDTICIVPPGD